MCKISVIMPSYNVVKYIQECLDSVCGQTLADIEIICVDAGSEDGTFEVIEKCASQDSRISLIMSDKKSYGYQMNLGLAQAKGEYVGILETDDIILPEMYEKLYEHAVRDDLEFVKADHLILKGDEGMHYFERVPIFTGDNTGLYDRILGDDIKELFAARMHTWSGIYKRDFLTSNHILHNETPGAAYQDNGFWFQTIMYAKKVKFVNEAYYCLRRDNPESSFFARDKIDAIQKEYNFIHDRIEQSGLPNKKSLYGYCFYYRLTNYAGQERRISDDDYGVYLGYLREDVLAARNRHEIKYYMFHSRQIMYLVQAIRGIGKSRYSSDVMTTPFDESSVRNMWCRFLLNLEAAECEQIYIYGAGIVGTRTYHMLCMLGYEEKISGFIVTEPSFDQTYLGKELIAVTEVDLGVNDLIIVAVSSKKQPEIEYELETRGISRFICMAVS